MENLLDNRFSVDPSFRRWGVLFHPEKNGIGFSSSRAVFLASCPAADGAAACRSIASVGTGTPVGGMERGGSVGRRLGHRRRVDDPSVSAFGTRLAAFFRQLSIGRPATLSRSLSV